MEEIKNIIITITNDIKSDGSQRVFLLDLIMDAIHKLTPSNYCPIRFAITSVKDLSLSVEVTLIPKQILDLEDNGYADR